MTNDAKEFNRNFGSGPVRYGHIIRYNPDREIGTIFSDGERFFFHVDRITKGRLTPVVGDEVQFRVAVNQQIVLGKLPAAHSIEIIETDLLENVTFAAGTSNLESTLVESTQPVAGQKVADAQEAK